MLTPVSANEILQLTENSEKSMLPYWSSDGEKIVYVSITPYDTEHDMQLWMMDEDGSNKTQLLNRTGKGVLPSSNPLSSDGRMLLYISNTTGNYELWVMDTTSLDRKQLTHGANLYNYFFDSENWKTSWRPNSSQIVYVSATSKSNHLWKEVEIDGKKVLIYDSLNASKDSDIWVIDADGTNNTKLTDDGKENTGPEWHPSGEKIAFCSNLTGNGGIWIMDKNGSNKKQLAEGPVHSISWSPDGTKIAYVKEDNEKIAQGIWIMDADGSNKKQLTYVKINYDSFPMWSHHDYLPQWSPDGTKIAFSRMNQTAIYDIFMMDCDGSNLTALTSNDNSSDLYFQWSPKGDKIAFTSSKDGNMSVSVIILDDEWRSAPSEAIASLPVIPHRSGKKASGFTASLVMMTFLIAFAIQKRK
jgi:Tol biopolymer transport system component